MASLHQSFTLVKCVIPHKLSTPKYYFVVTDKIPSTYHVGDVCVAQMINTVPKELSHMPITIGVNATEDAIVEYVAVPKEGFKETIALMKEWSKMPMNYSFMTMFWKLMFIEAGNQLALMTAKQAVQIVGIPMELLHDELMKELFGDE